MPSDLVLNAMGVCGSLPIWPTRGRDQVISMDSTTSRGSCSRNLWEVLSKAGNEFIAWFLRRFPGEKRWSVLFWCMINAVVYTERRLMRRAQITTNGYNIQLTDCETSLSQAIEPTVQGSFSQIIGGDDKGNSLLRRGFV